MMSMLEWVARYAPGRKTAFIHASRNEGVHAFKEEVGKFMNELESGEACYVYENPHNESLSPFTGYVNKDILKQHVDAGTECYVCGPAPFMKAVIEMLKEMGVSKVRYEFFGPAMDLSKKESTPV